jgi:signal transduction histidine kinase
MRPSMLPAAAVVALVSIVGSIGAAHGQTDRRGIDAVAVALLLVAAGALAVRDRHIAALVAFAAASAFIARGHPYGPVFAAPLVALFLAGLTPHRRRTWIVAAAGGAMFLAAAARSDHVGLVHLGLVVGWLAAFTSAAEVVRNRRVEAMERARRRSSEQRLHIARELHDVLAHDISLINVQAGVALHLVDEQPEQARIALANIKEASRDALHELRTALDVLRTGDDASRAPAPTLAGLPALVEGVRASGLDVRLDLAALPPLPAPVELAAYRIVQEALTNVTRHARATTARVAVTHDGALHVEVLDDGVGGDPVPGNGLVGMRHRATSLGGTFDAGPTRGGFAVRATLPT